MHRTENVLSLPQMYNQKIQPNLPENCQISALFGTPKFLKIVVRIQFTAMPNESKATHSFFTKIRAILVSILFSLLTLATIPTKIISTGLSKNVFHKEQLGMSVHEKDEINRIQTNAPRQQSRATNEARRKVSCMITLSGELLL